MEFNVQCLDARLIKIVMLLVLSRNEDALLALALQLIYILRSEQQKQCHYATYYGIKIKQIIEEPLRYHKNIYHDGYNKQRRGGNKENITHFTI